MTIRISASFTVAPRFAPFLSGCIYVMCDSVFHLFYFLLRLFVAWRRVSAWSEPVGAVWSCLTFFPSPLFTFFRKCTACREARRSPDSEVFVWTKEFCCISVAWFVYLDWVGSLLLLFSLDVSFRIVAIIAVLITWCFRCRRGILARYIGFLASRAVRFELQCRCLAY